MHTAYTQRPSIVPDYTVADTDPFAGLLAALAAEHPIGYSVNLARIAGDVKAGLMLSQMLYWTRVGTDIEANCGWIVKTKAQWQLETGLSRCEQESARTVLRQTGMIEESRIGMPAKLAFRVRLSHVSQALAKLLRSEPVQWSLFDVRSNAHQVRALLGKNLAFYRIYNQITRSVPAAIFLSRALSIQKTLAGSKYGDWFTLNPSSWAINTGLSAAQLRNSRQKLQIDQLLEQAVQYPGKRLYYRINIRVLTQKLLNLRLHTPSKGLLGLFSNNGSITIPHAISNKQGNRNKITGKPLVTKGKPLVKTYKGKPLEQLPSNHSKAHKQGLRTKWPIVSPVNNRPNWPINQQNKGKPLINTLSDQGVKLPLHLQGAQNGNCANSAKPVCRFSQGVFSAKSAQQTAKKAANCKVVFNREESRFSQTAMSVLTSLRARAYLTTYKTTPPTTKPKSPAGGGGIVNNIIWPKLPCPALLAVQRMVCEHRLVQQLDSDRIQLVIDELAANHAKGLVRNASVYLASLFAKEAKGELVPAAAYQWQEERKDRKASVHKHVSTNGVTTKAAPANRKPVAPKPQVTAVDIKARALWQECVQRLGTRIAPEQINVWLKPLDAAMDGQVLLLRASSHFKAEHIKSSYLKLIEQTLGACNASGEPQITHCRVVIHP